MRPVAPRLRDLDEVMIAEEQEEFMPLAAALQPHTDGSRSVICRWTLTDEERTRIGAGEDIYIAMPQSVFPHSLSVGDPFPASGGRVVPEGAK